MKKFIKILRNIFSFIFFCIGCFFLLGTITLLGQEDISDPIFCAIVSAIFFFLGRKVIINIIDKIKINKEAKKRVEEQIKINKEIAISQEIEETETIKENKIKGKEEKILQKINKKQEKDLKKAKEKSKKIEEKIEKKRLEEIEKEKLDKEHIIELCDSGKKFDAILYINGHSSMSVNGAKNYISSIKHEQDENFINKIKSIPNSDTTWTKKEIRYLRTILIEDEEVLDVVSGIMQQNDVNISKNFRETSAKTNSSTRTWLMALTNHRIILINRHLLVGTEHIEIALDMINSISYQSRLLMSSISIMHGSGGIIVNNILKGCERPFVDRANKAIENVKQKSTISIVNAINNSKNESSLSVANEILKLKDLLEKGIITQEEFDSQKEKLLK
jgi:hypothetical protein